MAGMAYRINSVLSDLRTAK